MAAKNTLSELQGACYAFIRAALGSSLSSAKVVWANDTVTAESGTKMGVPRPALPYILLQLTTRSVRKGSTDNQRQYVEMGQTVFKNSGWRGATLNVQAFGDGAVDWLSKVKDSVDLESVQTVLTQQCIAVEGDGDVQDLTEVRDTTPEYRGSLDLFLAYPIQVADDVGIIERVEIHDGIVDETVVIDSTP